MSPHRNFPEWGCASVSWAHTSDILTKKNFCLILISMSTTNTRFSVIMFYFLFYSGRKKINRILKKNLKTMNCEKFIVKWFHVILKAGIMKMKIYWSLSTFILVLLMWCVNIPIWFWREISIYTSSLCRLQCPLDWADAPNDLISHLPWPTRNITNP